MEYKGRAGSLAISLILAIVITTDIYLVYGSFDLIESAHIAFICTVVAAVLWFAGKKYDTEMLFAYNDALTGIYNRRFVNKIFTRMISQISMRNEKLNVMLVDVNKFKQINDTHGHEKGDIVLKKISDILLSSVRKSDVVARWGGDEFLILTPCSDRSSALKIIQRIDKKLKTLSESLQLEISVSTGIAVYPDDALTARQLIQIADANMYKAKNCIGSRMKPVGLLSYAQSVKQYNGDKFEIQVNTKTRIVSEKNSGFWTLDDFRPFNNTYNSILNDLSGKEWAKLCDLSEYVVSSIADEMKDHISWLAQNGYTHCAVVFPKSLVKSQIGRCMDSRVVTSYFSTVDEAKNWLRAEGYR